jgi:hypothetical protein
VKGWLLLQLQEMKNSRSTWQASRQSCGDEGASCSVDDVLSSRVTTCVPASLSVSRAAHSIGTMSINHFSGERKGQHKANSFSKRIQLQQAQALSSCCVHRGAGEGPHHEINCRSMPFPISFHAIATASAWSSIEPVCSTHD